MKLPAFLLIIMAVLAYTNPANAQHADWYIDQHNEFYLQEGIATFEEANGWEGLGSNMSGYISMPRLRTGSLFITYRHFFIDRFAVGLTVGIDNEEGDLSLGDPKHNASGVDGISGHYDVHTYTISLEALWAYKKEQQFMFYGYLGMGITHYEDYYSQDTGWYYYRIPSLPSNPYDYQEFHYAIQVTPLGFRFGRTIAGFLELGFGYKGFISGGISARF